MNKADLAQAIACGGQLRMALLEALRAAPPPEKPSVFIEKPSAFIEMLMSSGRAFPVIQEILTAREVLTGKLAPRLWQAKVIHENVCGQAIHEVWKQFVPPFLAQAECEWMTPRWPCALALAGVQNAATDKRERKATEMTSARPRALCRAKEIAFVRA